MNFYVIVVLTFLIRQCRRSESIFKIFTKKADISLISIAKNLEIGGSIFDDESISRLKRATVPTIYELILSSDIDLFLVTVPKNSEFPLHSLNGNGNMKLLYGDISIMYLELIDTVAEDSQLDLQIGSLFAQDDAYAGDDDCVCRGGKCPRREGCTFWVQKKMRDNGLQMKANLGKICTLTPKDHFQVMDCQYGIQLIRTTNLPAAYLLAVNKENVVEGPFFQYYRADKAMNNDDVNKIFRLIATDKPLGVEPQYSYFFERLVI